MAGLRASLCLLVASLALALTGCGGGGGGGPSGTGSTALAAFPGSLATLNDSNVVPVLVESGPGRNVNIPYVTVTVCRPGTDHCQSIDHVLLDTGSTGLRLFASQLDPALALPAQHIGDSSSISECAEFVSMLSWGPVHLADVLMGGERAPAVPIQLMDADFAPVPAACGGAPRVASSAGSAGSGKRALNANGILGVGLFINDAQIYFDCPTPEDHCRIRPAGSQQVQNPVRYFSVNNNGVAIQLPALPAQGVGQAQGYLVFGVGTQRNNQLGVAHVVPVDPLTGYFTTVYQGRSLPLSSIDSGANGLYFDDPQASMTGCTQPAGFYCPQTEQQLSASIALANSSAEVKFQIANANALFGPGSNLAFNNLGGSGGGSFFTWGLPFFFGRTVFAVIEGQPVRQGAATLTGPFNAFSD
ncbi:MAG: DUF3443 family protein [Rhodoferax sp.]|nr:DUF3443 family protein [Rhodoferax sp.]